MVGDIGKFELTTITGDKTIFYNHKTYGMQTDVSLADTVFRNMMDCKENDYVILETGKLRTTIRKSQILKIEFIGITIPEGGEE